MFHQFMKGKSCLNVIFVNTVVLERLTLNRHVAPVHEGKIHSSVTFVTKTVLERVS